MARRPKPAGVDPFADLAKKIEILEREMATQRTALERLKSLGAPQHGRLHEDAPARKTA
jgi:hypothetical protein